MTTPDQTSSSSLADEWRTRADALDLDARALRLYGDQRAAEDAEAAALDYRIAADELA